MEDKWTSLLRSQNGLECAICKEILNDPRVLPCGHVYCGGSKVECLKKMLQTTAADGGDVSCDWLIKCALCNTIHNVSIESLPPIYGLRDFLQSAKAASESSSFPKRATKTCPMHALNELEFVCSKCRVELCKLCFEESHSWHPIKLKASVDQQNFCRLLTQVNLARISLTCKEYMRDVASNLERAKKEVLAFEELHESLAEISAGFENCLLNKKVLEDAKGNKLFDSSCSTCVEFVEYVSQFEVLRRNEEITRIEISKKTKSQANRFNANIQFNIWDCFLLLLLIISVSIDLFLEFFTIQS